MPMLDNGVYSYYRIKKNKKVREIHNRFMSNVNTDLEIKKNPEWVGSYLEI